MIDIIDTALEALDAPVTKQDYLEIIDIRSGGGRKTGKGAAGERPIDTMAMFFKARKLEVPKHEADFLLDYYNHAGDITQAIGIDAAGFEALTGEAPQSPEFYIKFDEWYWKQQREISNQAG